MKLKRYHLQIFDDLSKAALEASKAGHHFEAAIINFQRLEVLLRLAIAFHPGSLAVNKSAFKAMVDEQSFRKIIVLFSFVRPKNKLSERLMVLNQKRNSFIHKIFTNFNSTESLKHELKSFNLEIIDIIQSLTEIIESSSMGEKAIVVIGSEAYEIEQLTTKQIEQVFKDLSKILGKTEAVDLSDPFSGAPSPVVRAVLKNGRDEAFRWIEMVTEVPAAEVLMKITRPQLKHFLTVFFGMVFHPSVAPAHRL